MDSEVWKDIVGYEGKYQISNQGNVKTLKRDAKGRWGDKCHRVLTEKLLSINTDRQGYKYIGFSTPSTGHKYYKIHRLVALAFIPNPENKPQVNHIDGDKANNHLVNLEWATREENQSHRYTHLGHVGYWKGKKMVGRNPRAKYCYATDVHTGDILEFDTVKECAAHFGVSKAAPFQAIKRGQLLLHKYQINTTTKKAS